MTQAEYAQINKDYKGTRIVGNSHRVRTAMVGHSLVCVFLTDAKTHEPPEASDRVAPVRDADELVAAGQDLDDEQEEQRGYGR
jgi:hypothetical protein